MAIDKKTTEKINRYSDMILDLIYNQDEFTTSDLQGVVQALVIRILADKEIPE